MTCQPVLYEVAPATPANRVHAWERRKQLLETTRCLGLVFALILCTPCTSRSLYAQPDTTIFEEVTPPFPAIAAPATLRARVVQDRRGFLWMSDGKRLFKYDGYQYTVFAGEEGASLFPGPTGTLFIAGGRHDYICATAWVNEILFFQIVHHSRLMLSLKQSGRGGERHPACALEDRAGRFWIGTAEGELFRIHPPDSQVVVVFGHHEPPSPGAAIRAIAEDSMENIWFGGDCGLFRIPARSAASDHGPAKTDTLHNLPCNKVAGLAAGTNGILWVSMSDGRVGSITHGGEKFQEIPPLPLSSGEVERSMIAEDRNGDLWVATTDDGLFRRSRQSGTWQRYLVRGSSRPDSNVDKIDFLYMDRSGILWIKTSDRGLIRYIPPFKAFHSYPSSASGGLTLTGGDIYACTTDHNGTLWAGSFSSGLEFLPRGAQQFGQFRHSPTDSMSLSENSIISICVRKNGELWVGTIYGGINVFDSRTNGFTHLIHRPGDTTSLKNGQIKSMYEDREGSVWIGHAFGLDCFDPVSKTFSPVLQWDPATVPLQGSVTMMCEDRKGNLWVGTLGRGLYRLRPGTRDTLCYRHDPADTSSISSNNMSAVFADSGDVVWIGSEAGLSRLDQRTGKFTNIPLTLPYHMRLLDPTTSHPSDDREIRGVLADRRGRLWLSLAEGGIGTYDVERREFRRYGRRDGVIVSNGRRGAFFTSLDGTIYCGGNGGITWFHPDSIMDDDSQPYVAVTQFLVFHEPMKLPPGESTPLPLAYWQNTLSFEFALLDFREIDENSYQYMLEGADKDWIPSVREHEVTYANVSPGHYRFKVRGMNGHGVRSLNEASVEFIIAPPYWNTWWFRGLLVLLTGGVLFAFYRYRVSKILALERLRLRIADDLHDDIGSALSGIALESDLIARQLSTGTPAHQRLMALGGKVRRTSDTLRDTVWIINPEQDRIQDLVARMRDAASTAFTDLQYTFQIKGVLPGLPLDMQFRRHVLLMFKEMLHNAAKHAHAQKVAVDLEYGSPALKICVRDDGVGFDTHGHHTGRGLRSMHARAAAIGGTLVIESAPGSGTVVTLTVSLTH